LVSNVKISAWLTALTITPSVPNNALFIWLIIRLIQLVFSAGTIFFSHKKSANSVFQPAYNSSRTGPMRPFAISR
jgi:hypothetical protein